MEENKTLLHLDRCRSVHSHPGAVQVVKCGCKTPSAHQWGTSTPPPLTLQQQNANDLLSLPPWTSGHVCINTHSAWSGLLHHHPAFQRTPEVLPQGRRPKQPHTYGTATHTLSMRPRESVSMCECVWAQLEEAVQHFAYVWKRAHQRRGPEQEPTWVYLLIFSVLPCSFRYSYVWYMTKSSALIPPVPMQTLANNAKVLPSGDVP